MSFGFSARHWQQIEAGRPITVTTLLRICEVLQVPVARLLHKELHLSGLFRATHILDDREPVPRAIADGAHREHHGHFD